METIVASDPLLRVLLVEDDRDQAALVRHALTRHVPPFEVTVVSDGAACLDALAAATFAVVLLDSGLPGTNGLAVLERIRARDTAVPVIMVTGQGDERVVVEAMHAGAFDYVMRTAGYATMLPIVIEKVLRQHALVSENARLQRETERQLRHTETLLSVSQATGSTLELSEVARLTIRELVRVLGADCGSAWRLNPGEDTLRPIAGYHSPREAREAFAHGEFPVDHSLFEAVRRHGRPICSTGPDDPLFGHPLFRLVRHESAMFVAMRSGNTIIGAFALLWLRDRHRFTPDEMRLADGIARQASSAFDNARLLEEVTATRDFLRSLLDSSADLVTVFDASGVIRYASPSHSRLLGYSLDRLVGQRVLDFIHPGDRRRLARSFAQVLAGRPRLLAEEVRFRHADGSWRLLDASGQNLLDTPGVGGLLVNSRDITHQRGLEEQLRQGQKMEALGRLAGGVAHDFNNMLAIIMGYGSVALRRHHHQDKVRRDLEEIMRAAERAAQLTRQLLTFSRSKVLQPEVIQPGAVAAAAEAMLRRLVGEDIALITRIAPDAGWVYADPGQLEQVLMNLVVNARDAMQEGGTITIDVAPRPAGGSTPGAPGDGPHVVLSVTDTGCGMDAATQARIFEPFFTTKEKGQGTGLGLATVYGIVKQSGGAITLDSQPGAGTSVHVYLPRVAAPASDTADGMPAAVEPASGTETILLAEDEDGVREIIQNVLTERGYRVLTAGDGAEAARILEQHGGPIHLLVTDVVMPRMNGTELVSLLPSLHPETKVLYISGYPEHTALKHLSSGVAFLEKPFPAPLLAVRVGEMLGRAARSTGTERAPALRA